MSAVYLTQSSNSEVSISVNNDLFRKLELHLLQISLLEEDECTWVMPRRRSSGRKKAFFNSKPKPTKTRSVSFQLQQVSYHLRCQYTVRILNETPVSTPGPRRDVLGMKERTKRTEKVQRSIIILTSYVPWGCDFIIYSSKAYCIYVLEVVQFST